MTRTRYRSSKYARAAMCALCAVSVLIASNAPAGSQNPQFPERAYQDREIIYELGPPESHAFRITHDYTERKEGTKYYFNVVREGSHVSDPESIDLDSGENLKHEVLSGKQVKERQLGPRDVKDDAEVVVTHFARALAKGTTNRVRLKETYSDPKTYFLEDRKSVV